MKNEAIIDELTVQLTKLDEDVTAWCAESSAELAKRNLAVNQELEKLGLDSIEQAEHFIRTLQRKK